MDIQKSAEDYKKDGNTAFAAKNYQKAITAYSEAIKLNPKDHSYFSNRATAYYNLGDYLKCISDCQNANSIKANFTKTLRRKGLACQQILKFQQAVNAFKTALDYEKEMAIRNQLQQAESLKSNYDRYVSALERNDYVEALSCINYLVNKVPQSEKLKQGKVECLAKTGDTTDALTLLKTIRVGIDQSVPEFWYLKGIIELYGGESSRAKKFFTEGMRLDPDHKKCRLALNTAKKCESLKEEGNQLLKSGKFEEAEQKYTQAINLDPSNKKLNAIIYSNRALTFMKRKETFKALDDLNKSLDLNPNYDKSLIRRADLNFERGEYTAAIMDYNKIQQLDPSVNLSAKIKQAKKKEKQSKKKDYYKILEVDRNASDQQIKKSYKKLALLYHPDRNRNKSEAEQQETSRKFKEVAEAYGCLSDPKKKQMYDTGQIDYDGDQGSGFGGMGGGIDPTEMFKMFFGGGGGMGGMGGFGGMGGEDFGFGGRHGGGNQKYTFRFG